MASKEKEVDKTKPKPDIFLINDGKLNELFPDIEEKEFQDLVSQANTLLQNYPPTKEDELMLSKIKLGDLVFKYIFNPETKLEISSLSKVGEYSDLEKEITDMADMFVTLIGLGGRVIHVTSGLVNKAEVFYWHGTLGWHQVGIFDTPSPLIIAHLDTPEHYRFAYDLFHNEDGTHRIQELSRHLWRPPTTQDSLQLPFVDNVQPFFTSLQHWIMNQQDL
jgi:hypothetical protein